MFQHWSLLTNVNESQLFSQRNKDKIAQKHNKIEINLNYANKDEISLIMKYFSCLALENYGKILNKQ